MDDQNRLDCICGVGKVSNYSVEEAYEHGPSGIVDSVYVKCKICGYHTELIDTKNSNLLENIEKSWYKWNKREVYIWPKVGDTVKVYAVAEIINICPLTNKLTVSVLNNQILEKKQSECIQWKLLLPPVISQK